MPDGLNLDRAQLSKIAGGVPRTIAALEQLVDMVGGFPSTIEEANALAGAALTIAQAATASLAILADALALLEGGPALLPHVDADDMAPTNVQMLEVDDTAPRAYLGTMAAQSDDAVSLSGPLTSTVATGTAPLVIASTTRVANLNVERAGRADNLGTASTYPADATDLPSVIALANALKAANQSKGV